MIPAFRKQRQEDLEFKASLVYRVSSRRVRTSKRNPIFKKRRERGVGVEKERDEREARRGREEKEEKDKRKERKGRKEVG